MKRILSLLLCITILSGLFIFTAAAAPAEESRDEIFVQAMSYLFPTEGSWDPNSALDLLLPLAEGGDYDAQYYCGWIYDFELEENTETELEANYWYNKALEGGILKAYVGAALNSFVESEAKTAELLDYAFSQGFTEMSDDELCADGLFWLGFMHNFGLGLEKDNDKALQYYIKAADKNSVSGIMYAAGMLDNSYMVSSKGKLCLELLEKAASRNYAPAMYSLGVKHNINYIVYDVESSLSPAFEWISKAAELGHSDAMHELGNMYLEGIGTEVNIPLGMDWTRRSAELGNSHAMCLLGHIYWTDTYVEKDLDMAMDWFIEATIHGNDAGVLMVGLMKDANEGMAKYYEREEEFLAAAALIDIY